MKLLNDNTPWEVYDVDGVEVNVKREDMCCPIPGPTFSKIRGVERHLRKLPRDTTIGVMDTRHSMAGWGVAYICNALHMRCTDFYPVLKADNGLRDFQQRAKALGATLYPLQAGMSAVLYNRAKSILTRSCRYPVMLPNGLKLAESVEATSDELSLYTPKDLLAGTWIVSISSGTIGAGVIQGLYKSGFSGAVILHMGYSRSVSQTLAYVEKMSGADCNKVRIIDEGYEYKDKVDNTWIPFPCNAYYDAKAFLWLAYHVHSLRPPVVFWNVGGDGV